MKLLKKIYFIYIKVLWYANNGLGEMKRGGTFFSSALSVGTFLKVFGFAVTIGWTIGFALVSAIASIVLGYFIVQKMEAVKYMNGIVNKENNELMDLINNTKRLEEKLDNLLKQYVDNR